MSKHKILFSRILIFAFILLPQISFEQDTDYIKTVTSFIDLVKQNNIDTIVEKINYPLHRKYPIPDVVSEKNFLLRYHQIFDDSLIKLIINSNIQKDWSQMGWRGIMFLNGTLWLDDDGDLIAVNNESVFEKKEWDSLVQLDKSKLYPALRAYKVPVLYWETKKFKIRIDDLSEGNYRYASWPINKNQSEKPGLVLTNGKVEFDGSGGNHTYTFKNKNYTYMCTVSVMGDSEMKPAIFSILKNGKEILQEEAEKIMGD